MLAQFQLIEYPIEAAFANNGLVKLTPRHDGLQAPVGIRISQVQLEQVTKIHSSGGYALLTHITGHSKIDARPSYINDAY
jgi:hypothetical protein